MFNYSEMNHVLLEQPITNENVAELLRTMPIFREPYTMEDPALLQFVSPSRNSEFCVVGEGYTVSAPVLTGQYARENFLYLQSFGILNMSKGYFTRRQGVDSYMILYTLGGEGRIVYSGQEYHLKSGDGIWIDCREPHEYCTVGDVWSHCVFHFDGAGAEAFYREYRTYHFGAFHQSLTGEFPKVLEACADCYGSLQPFRDVLIANGLSQLLTMLIREESERAEGDTMVETCGRILRYLEEHFAEDLSLDLLSETFHISKYYLSREFRRLTGSPPMEYVIQLRLSRAAFLLQCTDLPVCQIAEQVGIPNEQYFGKLFKRRNGMTPGQYRKAGGLAK